VCERRLTIISFRTKEICKLNKELKNSTESLKKIQEHYEEQLFIETTRFRQHLEQKQEDIVKLKVENDELKKREEQLHLKSNIRSQTFKQEKMPFVVNTRLNDII
jgi:hypothetical protein